MESLYKKKTFKFLADGSRMNRHAETFGARESSRFERLSMLRSMDEEEATEVEKKEEVVCKVEKPMSRLERLKNWKAERQLLKEMQNKNKPFYSAVKSSNKAALATTYQPSKILNFSKLNDAKSSDKSKIRSTVLKKPVKTAESSAIPSITKTTAKYNSIAPVTRNIPNSGNKAKTNENFLKSKSQDSSVPKQTSLRQPNKPVSKISTLPKPTLLKQPSRPLSKESSPKPSFLKPPNKHVSKIGIPASSLAKRTVAQKPEGRIEISASPSVPKRTLAPKSDGRFLQKTATFNHASKQASTLKFQRTVSKPGDSLVGKPKVDSKEKSSNKLTGKKDQASGRNAMKKDGHKNNDANAKNCNIESLEHDLESISEQSFHEEADRFDCSLSMIKPHPSFAPADFKFEPPSGLYSPGFDDDLFQRIKNKFIARTSTPTKPSKHQENEESDQLTKTNELSEAVTEVCDNTAKKIETNDISETTQDVKKTTEENHEIASDVCIDSPLFDVDPSKIKEIFARQMELMKLDEEELSDNALSEELDVDSGSKKKNSSVHSQRVSILNNVTDLGKIPEMSDCEEPSPATANKEEKKQRKSLRFSLKLIDFNSPPKDALAEKLAADKKPISFRPNRISLLKNITGLDQIAESAETSDCDVSSPAKTLKQKRINDLTPQRHHILTFAEESPNSGNVFTPRRSIRLQNAIGGKNIFEDSIFTPNEEKTKPKVTPRRSMRLINLNTPENDPKDDNNAKSNLTMEFNKLTLEHELENLNPVCYLNDIDSPGTSSKFRSKKVSLLYSPQKRMSMRKSIKGDLMSFSPSS